MDVSQLYEELSHDNPVPLSNASSNSTTLLVNAYFWLAAQLLLVPVTAAYLNLTRLYPSHPVFFTGHSLGASLATMLAYELVTAPPSESALYGRAVPPTLYTFGEPRLGNHAMSALLATALPSHHRVVHWRDAVPHLPPCPTTVDPVTRATVCSASNGTSRYYAYHAPLEVHYSSAMPMWGTEGGKGEAWKECAGTPLGEDQTCGDSFDWWSIEDHLHYYGVEVGDFCLTSSERRTRVRSPLTPQRSVYAE